VVVLVVGIGYLLVQRGILPFPPEATWPFPEVDGGGDNSAAIGRWAAPSSTATSTRPPGSAAG
jgi:hypothetical protein